MTESLAQSAARGAFFTLGAQLTRIVLQLASVAILARLLSPHDYGLFALVLVVVGLGEVFRDFGLTAASIQAPVLTCGQRDQLFWANALIGAILAVLVFAVSWPTAWLSNQPDLAPMLQVLSLLFILNGLVTQYRASLLRALRFKAIAIIDIASAALGLAAAVAGAMAGMGYWALVLQQLTTALIGLLGAAAMARWIPRWPNREEPIGHFIRFGWNLVATNIVIYAGSQLDTVLVGLRFGTSSLGLYNRAFQLVMTPLNQVRGPINSVAQPVFARVQEDQARFEKYVCAAQLALGYGIGVPLSMLVALADPTIRIMLGAEWTGAVPLFQCFAVAAFLSNLASVGYWVYVSRGLVNQLFRYTLVSIAIKVACLLVGSLWGVGGVALGFAIAPAIAWPVSIWWLSRFTPMPVRELYSGAARVIILGVSVVAASWFVGTRLLATSGVLWQLAAGIAAACMTAAAATFLVPTYRKDAKTLVWFVTLIARRGVSK